MREALSQALLDGVREAGAIRRGKLAPGRVTDVSDPCAAAAPTCAERLQAMRSAVVSQRMAGMAPDPGVVAELERAAREGTSFDAVVDAYLARVRAGMG